jgi:hypothetical protein
MEFVFNELSLEPICDSVYAARERMERFVQVIRAAASFGASKTVRTPRGFRSYPLAPDYVIENWVRDRENVAKGLRDYLLTIATKGPFCEEIWHALSKPEDCECTFNKEAILGLGIAYFNDRPAVGFDGSVYFKDDPVRIDIAYVDDDSVCCEQVEVCCMTSLRHVAARESWLKEKCELERQAKDGADLWLRREMIYPNLRFSDSCRGFIEPLSGNDPRLKHIARHLNVLNSCASTWESGAFDPVGIEWSNESEMTMKSGKLRDERVFKFPDGESRCCEPHSKLRGLNLRVHFLGETSENDRSVYVGYIGKHLPTASG